MVNMMTNEKYIGSTFSPLHKRMYERKKNYDRWLEGKLDSDRKLFTNIHEYGWECFRVELLEEVKVESRQQLYKIEGDWIRKKDTFRNGLNGRIEGQTPEQRKQQMKEWRDKNKEKIKEWNENNKENS